MLVMHGVFYPIKIIECIGHHFLDVVLYVYDKLNCQYAIGSRSQSVFCQCFFHTPSCIALLSQSFLKICAFE